MQGLKFVLILFICLFSHSIIALEKQANSDKKQAVKIHVELDDLVFNADGIYLIGDGELWPIKAVYTDSQGLYVKMHQAGMGMHGANPFTRHLDFHDRLHDQVTCQYCGAVYDRYEYKVCPICPKRLPKSR